MNPAHPAHHAAPGRHAPHGAAPSLDRIALAATLHCLAGCAIGEVAGLVVGTALGWSNAATIALAVVLAFVGLTLLGFLAANLLGRTLIRLSETILDRMPVVRGIYSTIKSMMDILSFAERESYRRVVLIQFPKNGHYCFAFVTGVTKGEMQQLSPDPLVHVYVPTSPNPTSGYFLLVPEREVIAVDITVEEAMKLIVSGGLYTPTPPSGGTSQTSGKTWAPIKQPDAGVQVG